MSWVADTVIHAVQEIQELRKSKPQVKSHINKDGHLSFLLQTNTSPSPSPLLKILEISGHSVMARDESHVVSCQFSDDRTLPDPNTIIKLVEYELVLVGSWGRSPYHDFGVQCQHITDKPKPPKPLFFIRKFEISTPTPYPDWALIWAQEAKNLMNVPQVKALVKSLPRKINQPPPHLKLKKPSPTQVTVRSDVKSEKRKNPQSATHEAKKHRRGLDQERTESDVDSISSREDPETGIFSYFKNKQMNHQVKTLVKRLPREFKKPQVKVRSDVKSRHGPDQERTKSDVDSISSREDPETGIFSYFKNKQMKGGYRLGSGAH